MANFYATSSATDINDLAVKLKDHLVNNAGYSLNSFTTESTGRRIHVNKNGMYFNFRSFAAETTPAGGVLQSGLFFNGSTGFNGSNTWFAQPGAASYGSGPSYLLPGLVQITASVVSYHFYWFNSADYDMVYFFVEAPAGTFQRLIFGHIDTSKAGTIWASSPQGTIYMGSQRHTINTYSNSLNLIGERQDGFWNDSRPQGMLYGSIPDGGTPQWLSGDFSITQSSFSPLRPQCFDSISKSGSLWLDTPNSFNSLPVQIPISIYATLDTAGLSSANPNVPFCKVGELPFLYWINLQNIPPGSTVAISTDNYRVFPFRKKSDTWNAGDSSVGTYRFGLSVRQP